MGLIEIDNEVRFYQKAEQRIPGFGVCMMQQDQLQNTGNAGGEILRPLQELLHKVRRFLLLVVLACVAVILLLAILNGNIMQNGRRLKDLPVLRGKVFFSPSNLARA